MMSIARPLPEKKLNIAWKTFRNRLTPGQKVKVETSDSIARRIFYTAMYHSMTAAFCM